MVTKKTTTTIESVGFMFLLCFEFESMKVVNPNALAAHWAAHGHTKPQQLPKKILESGLFMFLGGPLGRPWSHKNSTTTQKCHSGPCFLVFPKLLFLESRNVGGSFAFVYFFA